MDPPKWAVIDEEERDDYTGVTSEHVWRATKNKQLPYVSIYLAWIVCFLSVLVSAFFTFMFSLQWGGEKANKWLSAFLLSAGENIGIMSTAQVLTVAIVFACLLKEPEEEEEEDEEYEYRKTLFLSDHNKRMESLYNKERNIHTALVDAIVNLKETCMSLDPGHLVDMGPEAAIGAENVSHSERMMARKRENQEMFFFLIHFCFRVVYIICLIVVANGSTNRYGNIMYNDVSSTLGPDDSFVYESGPKAFWSWAESKLLPNLFGSEWYNGDEATWRERRFIFNREGFRVGPTRLRQLRTVPGGCPILDQMKNILIECNPEFSINGQDKRDYMPNWIYTPWNMSEEHVESKSPFVYQKASQLGGVPMYGHFNIYDGGGYAVELAEEFDEALAQVEDLKTTDWLDLYTRAVFVEFTVYSANANLFSNMILLFEMPSTGGILSIFFVEPFQVYANANKDGLSVLICQLVSVAVFLYYFGSLIKTFRKSKPRIDFFKRSVNLLELLHVCLGMGVIILFFMKNVKTSDAVSEVLEAKGTFYNFQGLAMTTYTYLSVLGLTIFVNAILLLTVLQVSWRFRVIAKLLRQGAPMFAAFFIQFNVLNIGFVTFFFTYFGKSRMEYSTFSTAFGSMFAVFLGGGANFKVGVAAGDDQFGRFMMILFCITMVYIYTSVFVSMIIQLIDEATDISDELGEQELDPVGYIKAGMLKQIKDMKEFGKEIMQFFKGISLK